MTDGVIMTVGRPSEVLLEVTKQMCEHAEKGPIDGVYILLEAAAILLEVSGSDKNISHEVMGNDFGGMAADVWKMVVIAAMAQEEEDRGTLQ